MWAQGLTIGILIAAGMLVQSNKANGTGFRKRGVDHSWKDIIELQEAEQKKSDASHS
jgi:hypothetical protein